VEIDHRALDRTSSRLRASDLSIDGLAAVLADALDTQRREFLDHVGRLHRLAESKICDRQEKDRVSRIHRRLVVVESELRAIGRKV
jgi:hypothetical protein